MPLAVSSWRSPWSPMVYASDASMTGYGVLRSVWDASEVAAVGRVKERSRWRKRGRETPDNVVFRPLVFVWMKMGIFAKMNWGNR